MRSLYRNLAGLIGFFLIWEGAVRVGLVPELFVPPPSEVLSTTVQLLGQEPFIRDVIATVLAWAIALGISIAIAVPAGLLLGSIAWLRTATRAIVEFLRPIPSVALIPLVLLVVGGGPEAKITLAVYAAVWPILFNTIYALAEIDPVLMDTARACGTSRARMLTSVALPHAAPFVFTGIRMSAAIALILVVSTEYVAGASSGLGNFILEASSGGTNMDQVLAGTVVAGVIGYLINDGLERVGRRMFRWNEAVGEAAK
ncbi:nitrate ABC transporter permease [Prauserella sp. PE36]|uniref:ABC transporter permease n=1 Tax=Prauserella sp. PE36 TaxID=1504709 RepID=UPI000D93DD1B|nr:ABC transporter permease [Prauserella sp. PE36]PXY37120.1 nitrate ABC transporter permease [Prauserella coralliicola]RBM10228.1 nitrate ABC transporter permease [Prauserella sp. PE36]